MSIAPLSPTERIRAKIRMRDPLFTNLLSEFYGTFLLLFIGIGVVHQFILSGEKLNTWVQINLGWGFAITFSVYTCAKTSGGHFNPCISLVMYTFGRIPFLHFILYSLVQVAGAALGSAASYVLYLDQYQKFTGDARTITGPKATAACFCSFPAPHVSNWTCFADQFVGCGLLALFVAVIIDRRNKIPDFLHPLLFGFIVLMIGTCYGMNLGYPINPARDLGPRIFASFLYGDAVFSYHNFYFWIPVIAPLPGAVFGAWSYHFFVGAHIPDDEPTVYVDNEMLPLKKNEEGIASA